MAKFSSGSLMGEYFKCLICFIHMKWNGMYLASSLVQGAAETYKYLQISVCFVQPLNRDSVNEKGIQTAGELMKPCLLPLFIIEVQNKTVRSVYVPTPGWLKLKSNKQKKNPDNIKLWQACRVTRTVTTQCYRLAQPFGETVGQHPVKQNLCVPRASPVLLLGVDPVDAHALARKQHMFLATCS